MKRILRNTIIASLTVLALSTQAFSSEPLQNNAEITSPSITAAIEILQKAGYKEIIEVETKYGMIKAKVRDDDGYQLKVLINPETNRLTVTHRKMKNSKNEPYLKRTLSNFSIGEALNLLKESGYHAIQSIEFEEGFYEADVIDDSGNKKEIALNAGTGEISSKWKSIYR